MHVDRLPVAPEICKVSEWVIKFNSLFGDSGHRGPCRPYKPCNHIAYTLESLSSLTQITHNLQAIINSKKKDIEKETQKSEGTH